MLVEKQIVLFFIKVILPRFIYRLLPCPAIDQSHLAIEPVQLVQNIISLKMSISCIMSSEMFNFA